MKKVDKFFKIVNDLSGLLVPILFADLIVIMLIIVLKFAFPIINNYEFNNAVVGISPDGLAGLLGSFLGCVFSLVAVFITVFIDKRNREEDCIKHENERAKSLAIEYRPIIDITSFRKISELETNDKLYDCQFDINGNYLDSNLMGCRLNFNIENIGRGEAVDMKISASCISDNNIYTKVFIADEERNINLLAKEAKLDCLLNIANLQGIGLGTDVIRITINIEYQNLNKTITYEYNVLFEIEIEVKEHYNYVINDYQYKVIKNNEEQ